MGRREDNKRRKREAMLASGLALFRDQGFERTSIEAIASGADVARGTFYLYFPDKEALFEALMARWHAPVAVLLAAVGQDLARATSRPDALAAYTRMAVGLAAVGLAHPEEILVAFRESRQPSTAGVALRRREQELIDVVVQFTAAAAEAQLIDTDHPRLAALVVYGAVERLFYEILIGTDLGDPPEVARQVLALFADALGLAGRGG